MPTPPEAKRPRKASHDFTPTQISERIKAERFSSDQSETAKAFAGIRVEWILLFDTAKTASKDGLLVFFVEKDAKNNFPLIICRAPMNGNEHLRLTEKGRVFRVKGMIEQASSLDITLRDSTFEPISE